MRGGLLVLRMGALMCCWSSRMRVHSCNITGRFGFCYMIVSEY